MPKMECYEPSGGTNRDVALSHDVQDDQASPGYALPSRSLLGIDPVGHEHGLALDVQHARVETSVRHLPYGDRGRLVHDVGNAHLRGNARAEGRRVLEAEGTECRSNEDEHSAGGAAGRARELNPARRRTTDDLVDALMRQAQLLRNLAQWSAAPIEIEHRLVVGRTPRFRHIQSALVFLAQLLDMFDPIHVYHH